MEKPALSINYRTQELVTPLDGIAQTYLWGIRLAKIKGDRIYSVWESTNAPSVFVDFPLQTFNRELIKITSPSEEYELWSFPFQFFLSQNRIFTLVKP